MAVPSRAIAAVFALTGLLSASLRAQTSDWPDSDAASALAGGIRSALAAVPAQPAPSAAVPVAPGACNPYKIAPKVVPNLDGPAPAADGASRLLDRGFPSVFEAWSPAQNLNPAPFGAPTPLGGDATPRHDVVILADWSLGLQPAADCIGLVPGYAANSLPKALAARAAILSANPHAVLLMAVHYYDASEGYLPDDSPWWLRAGRDRVSNGKANPKKSQAYYFLNYHDPEFRQHVALQCKAAVLSGVYDGCFFDWWSEDADRVDLARRARTAIGESPLIVVNVNNRRPVGAAPYINGMYMEGFNSFFWRADADGFSTAFDNLKWAAKSLRSPAITLLEGWYSKSRSDPKDLQMMRALTTLSLTQSDGAVLFGDPDNTAEHDHLHDWYPFWDRALGRPAGAASLQGDGSWRREYDGGTVVYNPPNNAGITVVFADGARTSRADRTSGSSHAVAAGDGDIFLK